MTQRTKWIEKSEGICSLIQKRQDFSTTAQSKKATNWLPYQNHLSQLPTTTTPPRLNPFVSGLHAFSQEFCVDWQWSGNISVTIFSIREILALNEMQMVLLLWKHMINLWKSSTTAAQMYATEASLWSSSIYIEAKLINFLGRNLGKKEPDFLLNALFTTFSPIFLVGFSRGGVLGGKPSSF